jgi:molybdopterin synthase sulfur carrier subunit
MITVRIPTQMRTFTGGASTVEVDGSTIADVLSALGGQYAGIAARLFDEQGKLRRFVNVYVEDEDIRFAQGLETPVSDGQTVSLLPAVAGG